MTLLLTSEFCLTLDDLDDRLLRFGGWLRVRERQELKSSLCLVGLDAFSCPEPPIHGLLALPMWPSDNCFYATQGIPFLGNANTATDHRLQQSLVLRFAC